MHVDLLSINFPGQQIYFSSTGGWYMGIWKSFDKLITLLCPCCSCSLEMVQRPWVLHIFGKLRQKLVQMWGHQSTLNKTINFYISLIFTVTVIQHHLLQMDLNVFPSTYQTELTILQEPTRSHGTVNSSPGPMGLLILTSV